MEGERGPLEHLEPADAGRDEHPGVLADGGDVEAEVADRLAGGDQRELHAAAAAPRLLDAEVRRRRRSP